MRPKAAAPKFIAGPSTLIRGHGLRPSSGPSGPHRLIVHAGQGRAHERLLYILC